MDFGDNKLDLKRSEEGVWVDLDGSSALLLARYRNPKHQAYIDKAMAPYIRLQRMNKMDEEVATKIENIGLAKYVLLGWKGMTDNGEPVEYSQETALSMLSDPKLAWFPELVRELASDMSHFREVTLEESVDNIKKLSSGA